MRLDDLPRTTSLRLALLFLVLFGVGSAAVFGFIYVRTQAFLIVHVDGWLRRESASAFRADAADLMRRFQAREAARTNPDFIFSLFDADGRVLAGSRIALPAVPVLDEPFDIDATRGQARFRGIAHRFAGNETVLIAQNTDEFAEFDERMVNTMLWGGALTGALGLLGAVVVGVGSVRRFDSTASAIQAIVSGDLSRRLPTHGRTGDVGRLSHVVNGMLDEIERLMDEVKGVCDNIAHDLRTPLTRLLGGLERVRRRDGSAAEYAAAVDEAIVELHDVLKTFSALLRIAEIEDDARRAGFADMDLRAVLGDVTEFYEPFAEERAIDLTLSLDPGLPPTMRGDPSLMFEAVGNLVDNAIKFTPEGGRVVVEAGRGWISVTDTGCGISVAEREAVLRRFYRSERSRRTAGNGLGLSLVAAIARLHGMRLEIEARPVGSRIALSMG